MKKTISMLGIAAMACIAMSCNDAGNNPDAVVVKNNGGKSGEVLSCVNVFPGITHCSINGANVVNNGGSVKTDNFDITSTRGVSSTFPGATGWTQEMDFAFPTAGSGVLKYSVTADGSLNSSLTITQSGTDDEATITPVFNHAEAGSLYKISLYKGDDLLGEQRGIGMGDPLPVFKGYHEPGAAGCWYPVQVNTTGTEARYELRWFSICPVVFYLPNHQQFICDRAIIASESVNAGYTQVQGVDVQGNMDNYSSTHEFTY